MIKEALGQVVIVEGNFHRGIFHLLSDSYSLLYPSLIQPLQDFLCWK